LAEQALQVQWEEWLAAGLVIEQSLEEQQSLALQGQPLPAKD